VSDPEVAAPAAAKSLVGAGADVLSIGESRRSLEDVYLKLIGQDGASQDGKAERT
jgi:ABC-2 type transport system ATP-binding protein